MTKWKTIDTAPTDGTKVDLWIPDTDFEEGGQRFTDMYYSPGSVGEANDWHGDMFALSDLGYKPDDVTHWMRVEGPHITTDEEKEHDMTDDIKALEQILAWTDCDQEDLHFVLSHPEAVARNMTALRARAEAAEDKVAAARLYALDVKRRCDGFERFCAVDVAMTVLAALGDEQEDYT